MHLLACACAPHLLPALYLPQCTAHSCITCAMYGTTWLKPAPARLTTAVEAAVLVADVAAAVVGAVASSDVPHACSRIRCGRGPVRTGAGM